MGHPVPPDLIASDRAVAALAEQRQRARSLASALPTNRDYLDAITVAAATAAE
jgi:hypothetical protein